MQGLKQGTIIVKEYTREFHRILITIGHVEETKEKVSRYINGLRPIIQEEITLVRVITMEDAYQIAYQIEDKMKKRYESKQRERGHGGRARGINYNNDDKNKKNQKNEDQGNNKNQRYDDPYGPRDQNSRGRGGLGRGFGRETFKGTYFKCGEDGFRAYYCPHEEERSRRRSKHRIK